METKTTNMDHAGYKIKVESMSVVELRYVIKDAQEAIRAKPKGRKAGYYAMEICHCGAELTRRGHLV